MAAKNSCRMATLLCIESSSLETFQIHLDAFLCDVPPALLGELDWMSF